MQLTILKALPGAGKSFIVDSLYSKDPDNTIVCSADHHFIKDGVYKFDKNQLHIAHKKCQDKARNACFHGVPHVIIDNTNITKKDWKPYVDIANEFRYKVQFIIPNTSWAFNAEECFERNQHGVPLDTIKNMLNKWEWPPNDLLYRFPA